MFDLLAILGVVCVLSPCRVQLSTPWVVYFLSWVALSTFVDAALFRLSSEYLWPMALGMVGCYAAFILGMVVLHRCNGTSFEGIDQQPRHVDHPQRVPSRDTHNEGPSMASALGR